MWAVMRRFGHDQLPDDLNGDNVHRLENVMTMNTIHHGWFDSLGFWFEQTVCPNFISDGVDLTILIRMNQIDTRWLVDKKYTCAAFRNMLLSQRVTPDPVNYPFPNPQYLAIHAACAKVAHMSGEAATIDKYHDDGDDGQTSDPIGVPEPVAKHAASKMPIAGYA